MDTFKLVSNYRPTGDQPQACLLYTSSCTLNFGGNVFQAAARGKAVLNEDDELVLKITINYLELSSTRILKVFFRPDQTIRLQMLETPSLRLVFQMLEKNVPDVYKRQAYKSMKRRRFI